MSDLKKIGLWFLVCLVLVVYAKLAGILPVKIGDGQGAVLGSTTEKPTYGSFLMEK